MKQAMLNELEKFRTNDHDESSVTSARDEDAATTTLDRGDSKMNSPMDFARGQQAGYITREQTTLSVVDPTPQTNNVSHFFSYSLTVIYLTRQAGGHIYGET